MYQLHILTGPWKGKRLAVRKPSLLIGRDKECHLRLPDDEVSRKHALMEERPDGVVIRDMGSLNGFLVNGQQKREARLADGDLLELGRTRVQFHVIKDRPVSPRRRLGWLQGIAIVAVAFLLLGQLFFLAALSLRSPRLLKIFARSGTAAPSGHVGRQDRPSPPEQLPSRPPPLHVEAAPLAETSWPAHLPNVESVREDLLQLRADVEALRQQVAETVPAAAPTALVAVAKSSPDELGEQPAAAPVTVDPLTERAQAMLDDALHEIQKVNLLRADQTLERIQIMAPDFLPAYIERARLYEQRGLLTQAGEQWAEVLRRSVGTPLYEQAAAERIRLARAAAAVPTPVSPPRREPSPPEPRLPRRIRVVAMEQEKLPLTEAHEEMRLLRVALRAAAGERQIDPDEVAVMVTFFDEDAQSREVAPTPFVTPRGPLRVGTEWQVGAPQTVSATYLVPVGARTREEAKTGKRWRYYGFAVRVYYREILQDEDARPRSLLEKVRTLPSPFHKPPSAAGAAH